MDALLSALQGLPPDVNRYAYLKELINPVPKMPPIFFRNLHAIFALAVITIVLCLVALAGKVWYRSIFFVRLAKVSEGRLLAFDTMTLWLLLIFTYSTLVLPMTVDARSAYLHHNPDAWRRFESYASLIFIPLWTAGWVIAYSVLVASLSLSDPVGRVPRLSPVFCSCMALAVPAIHSILVSVLCWKTHHHFIGVVVAWKQIVARLDDLAAQGTGYPTLTGIDLSFGKLLLDLKHSADERRTWYIRTLSVRLGFQVVLMVILAPASVLYLNTLRKQIWTVLPSLQGRGRPPNSGTASSRSFMMPRLLTQQTREFKELGLQYGLMLLEHVGVFVLFLSYAAILICFICLGDRGTTDGVVWNVIFSALCYLGLSITPVVQSFQALRAWLPGYIHFRSNESIQALSRRHVADEENAGVVEYQINPHELQRAQNAPFTEWSEKTGKEEDRLEDRL